METLKKILLTVAGTILFLPSAALAQIERTHLDAATIVKGYTAEMSDQNFRIGIGPDVFTEASTIKLEDLTDYPALPTDKNVASDVYSYNIIMSQPRVLEKPIWLALKYESDSLNRKQIYFYSHTTGEWHGIPTSIDQQNKYARAAIHFPHTHLVVLEEQQAPGPTKTTDSWGIATDARAAVVIDDKSGQVLFEKNANERLPLASLTKLMTAVIFLETNPDFNREVTISAADSADGCHLSVVPGDRVKVRDLFYSSLVGSKNNATKALAHSTGLSDANFVARMNQKATELGMTNSQFVETTGLDHRNRASAADYAKLSQYALRKMEVLQASTSKSYTFWTTNSGKSLSFRNTNGLVNSHLTVTGGKTGYLPPSWGGIHYNLMTKAKDGYGNEVIAVTMGNPSYSDTKYEVESLINWGFRNYQWE
ncbi:MAG: D-alanyl-D-alanine carboxypeptidase [Parcubacteria group bacterium]|nr:D-alanyl-D-alanine carboxypeptidase [Parcubacteria group bacterium]